MLIKLSKAIGLSQNFLIRMALDDLLKDKKKLRNKLFSRYGEINEKSI